MFISTQPTAAKLWGDEKKMTFFRMMKMDFRRMFLSGKFYFAMAGTMFVTLLNISQEAAHAWNDTSLWYLVKSSHGLGAFFGVFSVLAVLPFALSYWEDRRNHYLCFVETRAGKTAYCWSHLCVTFLGAFLCIFLGMTAAYSLLLLKMPMLRASDAESLLYEIEMGDGKRNFLILSRTFPQMYFIASIAADAVRYAFLAVTVFAASGKIKNLFVLASLPILLEYVSLILADSLGLPRWMRWYAFNGTRIDTLSDFLGISGYFLILAFLIGVVFWLLMRRRELDG